MKKKVVIQGLPNKSSKKKVVIEGLPKAQGGLNMSNMLNTYSDDNLEPIITSGETAPFQNLGASDLLDQDIKNPYDFNPELTNQLVRYYKGKGQNVTPNLTPEEQNQYNQYLGNRAFGKAAPIAGIIGTAGTAGMNFAKSALNRAGAMRQNENALKRESQYYSAAASHDVTTPQEYETQGYDFLGRNALAADGMQIRQIGGMGEPNVEVEGKEHIKLPNGFSQEIKGKSHADGGIRLNLPQGTKIFSEKLKIEISFLKELMQINPEYEFLKNVSLPKSGKISYADLAKKFETKKYVDLLNSKTADAVQKATAQMMIAQSVAKLEKIFTLQEQNKISGVHGPQVQQNAQQEYQESQQQEAQEAQQESEEPMMMHGGYHLPKAQNGIQSGYNEGIWSGDTYPSTNPRVQIPFLPEKSRTWNAMTDFKTLKDYADAVGYTGKLDLNDIAGTNLKIQKFVGENYPELVEKYHSGSFYGLPAAKTPYDSKLGVRWQAIAKEIQQGKKQPPTTVTAPVPKKTPETPPQKEQEKLQQVNRPFQIPGLDINVPAANIYGRQLHNWYFPDPDSIDQRYLSIEAQKNANARAMRAVGSTLGSRTASDISALLAAQANKAAADQQAFETKYNYDRAQDAAAQQFNANVGNLFKTQKQASWMKDLEIPIRQREANIGEQQLTDYYRGLERADQAAASKLQRDYIDKAFANIQNMTPEQIAAFSSPSTAGLFIPKGTASQQGKYGGKVKKKMKIKPKVKRSYF